MLLEFAKRGLVWRSWRSGRIARDFRVHLTSLPPGILTAVHLESHFGPAAVR